MIVLSDYIIKIFAIIEILTSFSTTYGAKDIALQTRNIFFYTQCYFFCKKNARAMTRKGLLKRNILVIVLMALAFTAGAQNKSYISNHRVLATLLGETYDIPAQLILAVAAIESSGGKGPAAKVLNNHFGIVGKNNLTTSQGFRSRYKEYPNEWASYLDFCQMLTRKSFYKRLKGNDNAALWVKAMSAAHYSEVPEEWEQKIFSVLSKIKMPAIPLLAAE